MRPIRLLLITPGLLVLVLASFAFRRDPPLPGGKSTFSLPFDLVDNRVFVEVQLNGQGPFHFILDTGAGGFSMTDRAARRLGVKVVDGGEDIGVGEKTVRYGVTTIGEFQLGEKRLENVQFAVMPDEDTASVFGTKPFDGFMGLEIFRSLVVKHDYVHKMLTFTVPDKFSYSGAGTIIHFELPRQIPVIEGQLDGVTGEFGVDTGARTALLLYRPFCERNKLQEKYAAKVEGVTGWGIGGPVRSLLARAKELKMGDVGVNDLVIRLSTQKAGATTSPAMAGLIGPDVLSQFDVTFDYARRRIILERNQNYGRHDSYDRSGMWMGQKGNHFTVVDVIPGGPADAAGIKVGETILAIDGRDTEKLILPEEREQMRRRAPGTRLTYLLESNARQRTVVVTLRDLV